jgi:hypothetical protein
MYSRSLEDFHEKFKIPITQMTTTIPCSPKEIFEFLYASDVPKVLFKMYLGTLLKNGRFVFPIQK